MEALRNPSPLNIRPMRDAHLSAASQRCIRIIPVALIMYTIAFIDRTNISLALPRISRDLHLDPQQAGTVAGIFLGIPGAALAKVCHERWAGVAK